LSEDDLESVRATLERAVNQLLHAPSVRLREALDDDGSATVIDAARGLFGLDAAAEAHGGDR
jgi:glutamyl-tRNA reductase